MDSNNKRKLWIGIMAALLMMLILLTGTYAWYANPDNVGNQIRAVALNYEFQNSEGATVARQNLGAPEAIGGITIHAGIEADVTSTGPWLGSADALGIGTLWRYPENPEMRRAMTRPTGNPGTGELFPLSVTEVNHYFGANAEHGNPSPPGAGQALRNGFDLSETPLPSHWWLRLSGVEFLLMSLLKEDFYLTKSLIF